MLDEAFKNMRGEGARFGTSSHVLNQANAFLKTHSLSELLPYRTYDEETQLFWNRNSVGFALEMFPLSGFDFKNLSQLTGLLQHAMPLGSNLQCLLIASSRIENWIGPWVNQRLDKIEALRELAIERGQYFRDHQEALGLKTFRLILSYTEPLGQITPQRISNILNLREAFLSTIKTLHSVAFVWNAVHLMQGVDEFLNPCGRLDIPDLEWNPYEAISNQLMSSSTRVQVNASELLFGQGDKRLRMYTARKFPSHWFQGGMGLLIGDPFDEFLRIKSAFFISYGIHICASKNMASVMEKKCMNVERQANSMLGHYFPSLRKEAKDWQYVRLRLSEGNRPVWTRYQVGLIGSEETIHREEQTLLNIYRSNKWELTRDQYIQIPSLINALPMTWGEGAPEDSKSFQRIKTTLTHEPPNLMPLQGEWQGTQSPGVFLVGRRGQPFWWSPFDNNSGGFSVSIVAPTGKGKSVLMQEIMLSILALGGKVFVIDVGRSFEKTARVMNGTFIEFSGKDNLCVNPFSAIPLDDPSERSDAITTLKKIISLMAAPKNGTDDLEDSYIEEAISKTLIKYGNSGTITHVAKFLLEIEDQKAKNLSRMLISYTDEGSYGHYFNGPSNIDLTADIVVLELQELKEKPDLQAVIRQMLFMHLAKEVYLGDRSKPWGIFIDEYHTTAQNPQESKATTQGIRQVRKHGAGFILATQSVNDFYLTPDTQVAFENSDWICLLEQKEESVEFLKRTGRITMDPYLERTIRSLRTEQGKYSEILIRGPHGYAVGRLMLDPFSKILLSTKADEFRAVKELQKQGFSLKEAVRKVAEEKYHA